MLNAKLQKYKGKPFFNYLLKIYNFIDEYLFIFVGLYFLHKAVLNTIYSSPTFNDYTMTLYLYVIAAFTAYNERRKDVRFGSFLVFVIPLLILLDYISGPAGYKFWALIRDWMSTKFMVIELNESFAKIPFNDAGFARIIKTETLTWYFRFVYNTGFVFCATLPIYRAAISKDFKKIFHYLLSAHVLQIFLISPFYVTFRLQEVWYVNGHPDGLARMMSPQEAAGVTLNCLPSMHTSIAFAMFLLVLREKDKIFKWVWGIYCLSVVYSTMYLEIHWVIDVIGGIILAYVTVKIVDFIIGRLSPLLRRILGSFYYRTYENLEEPTAAVDSIQ